MKKLIMVLCLFWGTTQISAQHNLKNKQVHVSYIGESIVQAGLRLGYSHQVWEKTKIKKKVTTRFPDGKPKIRSLSLLYQTGFYTKRELYVTVPTTVSLLYNRVGARGFTVQYSAGLGYDRTFLRGTTYKVNEAGEVKGKKGISTGYLTSQYNVGIGVDLSRFSNAKPFSIIYKNGLWMKHGYNNTALPHWITELSLIYHLNRN